MSSSKKYLDSRKAPEKSNFATTCNLLSQFLRESGKLKELSRSISGNLESIGKSDGCQQISKPGLSSSKNLVANLADLNDPPIQEEELTIIPSKDLPSEGCSNNKETTSKHGTTVESKRGQMTILYDGKIWVFDDLPPNKAYELMILASNGNTTKPSAQKQNSVVPCLESNPKSQGKRGSSANGKEKVEAQPDDDNNSDDLPIVRRSSLHRFLEKRRERVLYQFGGDFPGPSSEDDKELELRL